MIRLTAYEVRKLFDTRASVILFGCCILMATLLATVGLAQRTAAGGLALAQLGAAAVVPFAILAPVLGAVAASGDWTTGVIQHTLIVEPRRVRIFTAKAIAAVCASIGSSLLSLGMILIAGLVVALVRGQAADVSGLSGTIGGTLSIVVPGSLFGFAVGASLLSPPASISVILAVELVGDVALGFVPHGIGPYLQSSSVATALTTGEDPWAAVTSGVLWILLPGAIGFRRFVSHEASS